MKRRGVSLIELLVVVGLISILTAVSWPSLTAAAHRRQIRQYAYEIAGLLQEAQERALSEQHVYGVRIHMAQEFAQLRYYGDAYDYSSDPGYTIVSTVTLNDPPADIVDTTLYDNEAMVNVVRFNSAGLPTYSGLIYVSDLANDPNTFWTIELTTAGAIKVFRDSPSDDGDGGPDGGAATP